MLGSKEEFIQALYRDNAEEILDYISKHGKRKLYCPIYFNNIEDNKNDKKK